MSWIGSYISACRPYIDNLHNEQLSDRMKPLVIHQIQLLRTDGRILIQASDKVMDLKSPSDKKSYNIEDGSGEPRRVCHDAYY